MRETTTIATWCGATPNTGEGWRLIGTDPICAGNHSARPAFERVMGDAGGAREARAGSPPG
jgi:hypothetical protein